MWIVRLGRWLRPGSLARRIDRVEGNVVLGCVVVALLLVPVALSVGSLTYGTLVEVGVRESAARHRVSAVLTEDGPGLAARSYVAGGTTETPAWWRSPDGAVRTGDVPAGNGASAGGKVEIWVDAAGERLAPPLSTTDAVATAVMVAVLGWLAVVGALALGCWGLHVMFERRRMRAWQEEWVRIATNSY